MVCFFEVKRRARKRTAGCRSNQSRHRGIPAISSFFDSRKIRSHYQKLLDEFDQAACLILFASAEAELWVDFYLRVKNEETDPPSKRFRDLWKEKQSHSKKSIVRLEELLDMWTENKPDAKAPVADFNGLTNHRDWLAHGRYWEPNLGLKRLSYNPDYYEKILSLMLSLLDLHSIK